MPIVYMVDCALDICSTDKSMCPCDLNVQKNIVF